MIPEPFLARMRDLLGAEFSDFSAALSAPARHALRINRGKTEPSALLPLLPFSLAPLSFCPDGYLIPEGERAGIHPLHHAGAYYMQDPSAMATVSALPFSLSGMRVLDLCAAPGGKTSGLADAIGEDGILYSNEIVPSRARILLGNVERLGLRRVAVLSEDPREVAAQFDRYFDLAVVDAPCSGEGMFRKYPDAAAEWSPRGVEAAAARSRLILEEAAKTVREGGYLLYSTCTFSEEENEETVCAFLASHPDFSLIPVRAEVAAVTADGIVRAGRPAEIALARRFYPHRAEGEGQFIALLRRTAGGFGGILFREERIAFPKGEEAPVRAALGELLTLPPSRLHPTREGYAAVPEEMPLPPRGLVRAGVLLGTLSGKIFTPHHAAAMALGRDFHRRLSLPLDDARLLAFLRGEEIAAEGAASGYTALLAAGIPTGLLKCSGGRGKNHYPKGLRTLSRT